MKLYKYCSESYLIENLKNNQIFLGKIANCNDPLEGAVNFNVNTMLLDDFIKAYYPFAVNFNWFGKSNTIHQVQKKLMSDFKNESGICCFSETHKLMTMWGHYANKHHGVCLEFNKAEFEDYGIEKVHYAKKVPIIEILEKSQLQKRTLLENYRKACLTKSEGWGYEKEWRIIGDAGTIVEYNRYSLSGIYFGFNTELTIVKQIFEVTKDNEKLKYYKPGLKLDDYGVEFFEVTKGDLKD